VDRKGLGKGNYVQCGRWVSKKVITS
jgi:hypothetical protein